MLATSGLSVPVIIAIIVLVVIIAIAIIVSSVVRSAKRAIRRAQRSVERTIANSVVNTIARAAGGPSVGSLDSLMAQAMAENMEEQPKSVSAMTSMMLPRIIKDFPGFEYDEQRERANLVLTDYFKAINSLNADVLTDAGSELKKTVSNSILQMESLRKYKHYDNVKIHQTEITQYNKNAGRCIITFQSSVEYMYYVTDTAGNVIEGSKTTKKQSRYNMDMIYVQDRDMVESTNADAKGINCPNCGAPLSMLGSKQCTYCGAPVVEINLHAWVFNRVMEYSR